MARTIRYGTGTGLVDLTLFVRKGVPIRNTYLPPTVIATAVILLATAYAIGIR